MADFHQLWENKNFKNKFKEKIKIFTSEEVKAERYKNNERGKDGVFIKTKDWEVLKEHSLEIYLPFDGGYWEQYLYQQNYKTKKNQVLFYAVEFQPNCFAYEGSKKPLKEKKYFEKYKGELDSQTLQEWIKKGFKYHKRNKENRSLGPISFFKTGLTNTSAKARGNGKYKQIFIEEEISLENKHIEESISQYVMSIELLVRYRLFLNFWKERLWFYSPKRLLIGKELPPFNSNCYHSYCYFEKAGIKESWLFKDLEEKIQLTKETLDWAQSLNPKDLYYSIIELRALLEYWWRINDYKRSIFRSYKVQGNDKFFANWIEDKRNGGGMSIAIDDPWFEEIGFNKKWASNNVDHYHELFKKITIDEMIMPGSTSYIDKAPINDESLDLDLSWI